MDLGLKGKTALITGASQGIGLEIAKCLASEGVKCILLSRDESKLSHAIVKLPGIGHSFHSIDILRDEELTQLIQSIKDSHSIDLCIHNVGGTLDIKDPISSHEDWQRVWRFNVGNSILINNLLIPEMKARGFGRIVHISSIAAEALRGAGPYAASKAYLNAYVKVLGRALALHNIVVSGVMPGAIYAEGGHWDENSPHNLKDLNEFFRKKDDFLRHHQAIGRLGSPVEIAPWVAFLCSSHASFASGSLIPIDGGTM